MKSELFWKTLKAIAAPLSGAFGVYLATSYPAVYQALCSAGF